MPIVNVNRTTLKDAIDICLSTIGETQSNSVNDTSANVVMAKQIIEEVSRDVQSKGWWFNTAPSGTIDIYLTTANNGGWDSRIPEEARRYISIRAARIFQSRVVGSEELLKFTFQEEQVSLAILTQAHVRKGGGSTSFNSFPAELKQMGVEEILFLQQSAEEKLLTLRLSTELKSGAKIDAETELVKDQEALVNQQRLTEAEETIKRAAETELVKDQEALVTQQKLTEVQETSKRAAEKALIDAQELKVDAERLKVDADRILTEAQELNFTADTALKGKQGFLIDAQRSQTLTESLLRTQQSLTELEETKKRTAETELVKDQEELVTKQALTEVKRALDVVADTSVKTKQGNLIDKQAATELQNALKVAAETTLILAQELKVDADTGLVEAQKLDVIADTALKTKQGELIDAQTSQSLTESLLRSQQALTELQETTKRTRESELIDTQETLVKQQELTEKQETARKNREVEILEVQKTKVEEETDLLEQQFLTEQQETAKRNREVTILEKQADKVDEEIDMLQQQFLSEQQETARKNREVEILEVQKTKVEEETDLLEQQFLTEQQETAKRNREVTLLEKQSEKIDEEVDMLQQQFLTEQEQTKLVTAQELKTDAERTLLDAQRDQVIRQSNVKDLVELNFHSNSGLSMQIDGVAAGRTYRDFSAEMRMMGFVETAFQQLPAYKKVELIKDAKKLRDSTATETSTDTTELSEVNKVMRLIGELPVSTLDSNSLASECVRLLRDTDTELQGRGWWFNTEKDVEFSTNTMSNGFTTTTTINLNFHTTEHGSEILSVELNDYRTRIITTGSAPNEIRYLYDLDKKTYQNWQFGDYKGTVIYKRSLLDTPIKYREYLSVRVAILLTELYPQSGIDIQRLPKMEAELKAYFKDREFDEANYSVFDNFDAASRIGINRNYTLV